MLGFHSADLEMFVLEGGIETGDKSMGRYAYAYYPAGYTHEISTQGGATVLQWWNGKPDFVASTESKPGTDIGELIEGWNYGDSPSMGLAQFPKFRAEPVRDNSPIRMKLQAGLQIFPWCVPAPDCGRTISPTVLTGHRSNIPAKASKPLTSRQADRRLHGSCVDFV